MIDDDLRAISKLIAEFQTCLESIRRDTSHLSRPSVRYGAHIVIERPADIYYVRMKCDDGRIHEGSGCTPADALVDFDIKFQREETAAIERQRVGEAASANQQQDGGV